MLSYFVSTGDSIVHCVIDLLYLINLYNFYTVYHLSDWPIVPVALVNTKPTDS